jgi:hypothetical protein
LERSGARKTPRNQLTNKDLNARVVLDVKGNASKLVVQSFLNYYYVYIYKDYKNQRGIRKARCVNMHKGSTGPAKPSNKRQTDLR